MNTGNEKIDVKTVVGRVFVNTGNLRVHVKTVADQLFVNTGILRLNVYNVADLVFVNTRNKGAIAKSVAARPYVVRKVVKGFVIRITKATVYFVILFYIPKKK